MQRLVDVTIALLLTVTGFLLSWPFWRDFEYWAESHALWRIYFALGFVLGVYVFYVFIGSLRMLFLHARDQARAAASAENSLDDTGERP